MTDTPFFARVNKRAETVFAHRPGSSHEKPFGRLSMDKTTSCVVYWLHDDRCICPWRHGYIGISQLRPHLNIGWNENPGGGKTHGPKIRLAMKGRTITWGDKIAKTLTGHVRTLESRIKQSASVKGISKSSEWRIKASAAAKTRYSKPGERERTAATVRKALKGINRLQRHYRKHGQLDFDL
jgi:hypothetical protein